MCLLKTGHTERTDDRIDDAFGPLGPRAQREASPVPKGESNHANIVIMVKNAVIIPGVRLSS